MGLPCDWQINKQKISERASYLLETGQWSDCKFIVGQEPNQQTLKGHKLFLAMSSPVFEAMFFGGMAEKDDPIAIRDVQPEAFRALLEYIYTDQVVLESFELACELCYCAKKYMLPSLVQICTKHLWSDLCPKKVCRAFEFAKLFEEPILMEKCLQIICIKTEEVVKESSWEDVELATLITVLEQDTLQIPSEIVLFGALERWAKAECVRKSLDPTDGKSLRSVIGGALSKIRFLSLTAQDFAEGPGNSPLLTQDEAFAILMNILCSVNKTPMPEGFCKEIQCRLKPVLKQPLIQMSPTTSSFLHGRVPDKDLTVAECSTRRVPNNKSADRSSLTVIRTHCREGPKHYCLRTLISSTSCLNTNVLDCSVTFSVDKNICVVGIEVPTQLSTVNPNATDLTYHEVLYAHLLDSEGTRLTYTHYTVEVNFGALVEINFNCPVFIQKHKIYRVGVVFNKIGYYPMGVCTPRIACNSVFFSFGVGNGTEDSVRDSLIRSIVFTHAYPSE